MAICAARSTPLLVLSPGILVSLTFFYGFVLATGYLSMAPSTLIPNSTFQGLGVHDTLLASPLCRTSVRDLVSFTVPFIAVSLVVGLLLDQKIHAENGCRAIFLYPLALSQNVAGTAWQGMLNPGLGIEASARSMGREGFQFNLIGSTGTAFFCVAAAAVRLHSDDDDVIRAGQINGARLPTTCRRIMPQMIRPMFFSVLLILGHLSIKTFDLVVATTGGGPGNSTWLRSIYVYNSAFERGRMVLGAAVMMMPAIVIAAIVPRMYSKSRAAKNAA